MLSSDHCTKLYQQPSGTPCMRVSKLAGAGIIRSSVIVTTAMPATSITVCHHYQCCLLLAASAASTKIESTMQSPRCVQATCLMTSMNAVLLPCLLSDGGGGYLWNSPCGCCQRFLRLCVILHKIVFLSDDTLVLYNAKCRLSGCRSSIMIQFSTHLLASVLALPVQKSGGGAAVCKVA